jgi:hypothetical protein
MWRAWNACILAANTGLPIDGDVEDFFGGEARRSSRLSSSSGENNVSENSSALETTCAIDGEEYPSQKEAIGSLWLFM